MHTPSRRLVAASLALGLGALVADVAPSSAASHSVTVQAFAFQPETIDVAVGDTVTWTNREADDGYGGVPPHTATADDNSFNVNLPSSGASGSVTFPTAGTVSYHCNVHASMRGTVRVSQAGGGGTTTTTAPTTTQPTTTTTAATQTTTTTTQGASATTTSTPATTTTQPPATGATTRPTATTARRAPTTTAKPKAKKCKKGFVRKGTGKKARCVRKRR